MECRPGCGACCIAISISSPIPEMPDGKPAGARCVQLSPQNRCLLFGLPERPVVCCKLEPSKEMCGESYEEAYTYLAKLEEDTRPDIPDKQPDMLEIVDLSRPIYSGMATYPADPDVEVKVFHDYANKPWLLRRLSLGSHTATHVDACSHMDPHGKTLDDLPLNRFFGKAWHIAEDKPLPFKAGLIFSRCAGADWLDRILAAQPFFVGGNISEELQRALLLHGIVTYTDLANLDKLPVDRPFFFMGLPLKIKEGDGSPVRAAALLNYQGMFCADL